MFPIFYNSRAKQQPINNTRKIQKTQLYTIKTHTWSKENRQAKVNYSVQTQDIDPQLLKPMHIDAKRR